MIFQFLVNGIVNGSMIAIVAIGFSLIYNTTRIFHIAYAGIYIWAAYLLYFFMEILQWPLALSFLLCLMGAGLLSMACEIFIYRPLVNRKLSANALMISSLGVLILMTSLLELIFGNAARYIEIDLSATALSTGAFLSSFRLMSLLICLALLGLFFMLLKYSSLGIHIRALRDDERLSNIYGIKTEQLKILLFIFSGIFVGTAAGLSAIDVGINPHLGMPVFINAFVALVIGGIGRFDGPVIGGVLLGVLQSMTEYFFDSRWVMMVTFVLLIIFLLLRPQGIIPERRRTF